MTFRKYYSDQFRLVPEIWREVKKDRKPFTFIFIMLVLLCPIAIYTMYLYDMRKMKKMSGTRRKSNDEKLSDLQE